MVVGCLGEEAVIRIGTTRLKEIQIERSLVTYVVMCFRVLRPSLGALCLNWLR